MKTISILGTVLLSLCSAAIAATGVGVTADVRLVRTDNKQLLKDSSNTVVWLVPLDATFVSATGDDPHFRMSQKDKRFVPDLLVVPVGSYVDFPNLDPWFHNVFSLFRGKRFDLGLYQAGAEKSVRFDRAGVAYLFCNIHPEMSAVILAVNSRWYGISGTSGKISLANVPPGRYTVHVWHQDASAKDLENLRHIVDLDQSKSLGQITIPIQPKARHGHKNKYGHDYDPDPLKPEY